MKTALIIGGGFAGCAAAHQLALAGGWDVTLVESAPALGGGVQTLWYGGHPYTFGPRHFLTQRDEVFAYLNRYVPLRRCTEHQFITYVESDQAFYNFPIHQDDIARMPDRDQIMLELTSRHGLAEAANLEEYWIRSVGETLYTKFIKRYSQKMWLLQDNQAIDTFRWSPKGVAIKEGPRAAWDTAISAYPYAANGYNDFFDIATADARVLLSTRIEHYDIPKKQVVIRGQRRAFDVIVNTISPDILFGYEYGELPYIGRDFHKIVLPVEHCFPENVYFLYYANDEQFTRLVEYKKFTRHKSPTTLIGMEIPSRNGKYYPLPIKSEQARAQKYLDLMPEGVFSIGRAGSYRYEVDIAAAITQAMELSDKLSTGRVRAA
jgi:UDP-galactopyranose mutase